MYMKKCLSIILILLNNFNDCCARRYENYSIYTIYPQSQMHHKFLLNLHGKNHLDLIFLDMPPENQMYQILVNNLIDEDFQARTRHFQVKIKMHSSNAQELFEQPLQKFTGEDNFRARRSMFHTLDDIYDWLHFAANQYPNTKVESIGTTSEGRDILAFSIEEAPKINLSNLNVVIESGLHGNEWMGPASATYMIERILTADEGPYRTLRRRFFLYFIPVANPDGYVYSQTEDRLWKKNRRRSKQIRMHPDDPGGIGVNLNRNFDYNWGTYDSSNNPSSEQYHGPHPFSEPESQAIRDYIHKKHAQLTFFFSLHGHGQKFILPYSDSHKHLVNYHEVQSFAKRAAGQIENQTNRVYKIGLSSELMGKKYSGDCTSWVKNTYYIPFAYTIQLRDDGEYGYVIRSDDIMPACREISDALTAMMINSGRYRVTQNIKYTNNANMQSMASLWLIFGLVVILEINAI